MKTQNNFDAINFWKNDLSPFQNVVKTALDKEETKIVHLLTSPQVGKSHFAYRDLFLRIFEGWDGLDEKKKNRNKLYALVFPLASMMNSFLKEQIPKGFNKDKNNLSFVDIRNIDVRIPICVGLDQQGKKIFKMKSILTNSSFTGDISFTFFNGCRLLCFHSANAEQHINGYPFNHIVFDEYSKHYKNIIHIASPRLLQTKGKLLTVTTLNEDNPANWYYYEIVKDFTSKSKLISNDEPIFRGLDIYKKTVNEDIEINLGNNTYSKERLVSSNYLLIGKFNKIVPYIHNSKVVKMGYSADIKNGDITPQQDRTLYQCDVSIDENRFLSNYIPEINNIYLDGVDVNSLLSKQVIGYDHGSGKTKDHSGLGWARVGVIWDEKRPNFEQFIVLESGIFTGGDVAIDNVVKFFSKFPYWIFYDPSLLWDRGFGKTLIQSFFEEYPLLRKRMRPATFNNLKNDSRARIAFWQNALEMSLSMEQAKRKAMRKGNPFDVENYIEYKHPVDNSSFGCQIYIAQDKENPKLNERLIWEILNYRKKSDKDGKIQEESKAKTDVWDATSYAILGLQQWKKKIINQPDPAVKVEGSKKRFTRTIYQPIYNQQTYRQIPIQQFNLNNNFSNF